MDSEENATSCSVCREIYSDPRCLPCGHSFCLKCLKWVARNMQKFPCPICRFDVDLRNTNVNQLPKNFVLCSVIEAKEKKQPSMCLDHNKSLDLFCQRCNAVLCSKCLTMRHKGHAIEDIEIIYSERNKEYGVFLESTKQLALMIEEKRDAVKQSRTTMEENIDSIRKTVESTFKKLNDALKKQCDAIVSYLHQERDKKRQVFSKAEHILAGSMTTVTGLDTDIRELRTKDTSSVIQQYRSLSKRQEDTECKILQDIQTCFTPPDNLVIEVYAPWIEEAIDNIKPIDMNQAQARPGQQKIAEIQEENAILKRECAKLRNTQQELENRKTNEVENLEYLNQEICAQFTKVEKEFSESKTKWENDFKTNDKKHTKETEQLHKTIKLLKEEKDNLLTSLEKEKHRTKTTESECNKLREKKEELEQSFCKEKEDKNTLQNKYNGLEQDIQRKCNETNTEWEKYCDKLTKIHTTEKEQLYEAITNLTVEKDNLLTRLSAISSDRHTHENVNIADLTDSDRPTKLQEVYSELYDNEWTDAFEELTKDGNATEKDVIMTLLKILMSSFQNCREITWGRYERLKHVASYIEQEISLQSPKVMSNVSEPDLTKQEAESSKTQLEKNKERVDQKLGEECVQSADAKVSEASKDKSENKKGKLLKCTIDLNFEITLDIKVLWRKTTLELKRIAAEQLCSLIGTCLDLPFVVLPMTSKFLKRCIDLCWNMGIQEKPLHLDGFAEMDSYVGKKFDKDKFRPYTGTGSHIDFIVLPTLYLYEGGPILVKGIAQCCTPVEATD